MKLEFQFETFRPETGPSFLVGFRSCATLIDLHFVLTASFFKKGEYKEGKFHRQGAQQVFR